MALVLYHMGMALVLYHMGESHILKRYTIHVDSSDLGPEGKKRGSLEMFLLD